MLTGDQAYILSKEYTDAHGGGSGGTSNYPDLTNKPMINSVTLTGNKTSSDLGLVAAETGKGLSTNDYTDADETKLSGIEAGAQVNVQADWTEADNTSDAYIDHKPTLGTAAAKDSTNAVTDGSVDLVESGAVHSAIAAAISPVQGAVSANTSAISDIKDGTSIDSFGDVETALSGKADVVSSATNGDLAGLDANGNLTDSGIPAANVADHDYVDSGDSAQEALTRASVGWTGKNELPITLDYLKFVNTTGTWSGNTYTLRGVDFIVSTNTDGYVSKITADGTASEQSSFVCGATTMLSVFRGREIIMSGSIGGSDSTYGQYFQIDVEGTVRYYWSYDGDVKFIAPQVGNYSIRIVIRSGQTVTNQDFFPMLRDARIKDSTFEPYHESVDECKFDRAEQRVLGAKNLYLFEESDARANVSGTFTVSDGVMTVTCAAAANSGSYLNRDKLRVKFADYANVPCIFSFMYKSSIACDGSIGYPGTETMPTVWTKKEILVSDPSQIGHIRFYNADATKEPVISVKDFMLRLASDPDDTYVPYTMTNKELTDKTQYLNNNVITTEQGLSFEPFIKSAITQMIAKGALVNQGDMTKTVVVRTGVGRYIFSMGKTHEDHIVGMAIGEALNNSEFVYSYTISTDTVIAKQISIVST